MQESIRVLVAADTVEDTRKLEEIFADSSGFSVAVSTTTAGLGRLERTVADCLCWRRFYGLVRRLVKAEKAAEFPLSFPLTHRRPRSGRRQQRWPSACASKMGGRGVILTNLNLAWLSR